MSFRNKASAHTCLQPGPSLSRSTLCSCVDLSLCRLRWSRSRGGEEARFASGSPRSAVLLGVNIPGCCLWEALLLACRLSWPNGVLLPPCVPGCEVSTMDDLSGWDYRCKYFDKKSIQYILKTIRRYFQGPRHRENGPLTIRTCMMSIKFYPSEYRARLRQFYPRFEKHN